MADSLRRIRLTGFVTKNFGIKYGVPLNGEIRVVIHNLPYVFKGKNVKRKA